jgi:phosphoserine phosphatase
MNVYDFDNTIYRGDSTADFLLFEIKRHPLAGLKAIAVTIVPALAYVLKLGTKEHMKEKMFSIISAVEDMDAELEIFWDEHQKNIKQWYLQQQKEDDVIISASPYFEIIVGCDRIGIKHVIATDMDSKTGQMSGINCKGTEKVPRFRAIFPDAVVDEFYSDSRSDDPMAKIATKAFLVKGDKRMPW